MPSKTLATSVFLRLFHRVTMININVFISSSTENVERLVASVGP